MKVLLSLVLASMLTWPFGKKQVPPPPPPVVQAEVTPQQKAAHMLTYVRYGKSEGMCTGTVIGPHAIMTAYHCNEDRKIKTLRLDYTYQEVLHIERIINDGREHDIYLVDGPEFKNIASYDPRPTKPGEQVYIWGSGGFTYPPRKLEGVNIAFFDPSEVDQRNGLRAYSMPIISGDSGSAVWTADGHIVALTTYQIKKDEEKTHFTVDFEVAFTPEQIKDAEAFVPTPWTEKEEVPPPPTNPFSFLNF